MKTQSTEPMAGAKSPETKRDKHLSKDGKWRSFPKVPNLVQYVSTGTYFGKLKVSGKQIRQSLATNSFTVAKLKLADFVRKHQKRRAVVGTMADARQSYLDSLEADHTLAQGTKTYYQDRLKALFKSWPELGVKKVSAVTEAECKDWANAYSEKFDERNFNNTLAVLRRLLELGGFDQSDNPAHKVKRLGVKPTELHLPKVAEFHKLLTEMESGGARQSHGCADLVRFLAYSGCRISEARKVTWADVDLTGGNLRVENAKSRKRSNAAQFRTVPIIPDLRELLERLAKSNPQPADKVCQFSECEKSLSRACKVVGIARLTHHDLRHFFATRCIESGVDIPPVSRWLGHSDGGALAMKTYGHLRDQYSISMAQRVSFGGGSQ